MKVRPQFEMFPLNAGEGSPDHVVRISMITEQGVPLAAVMVSDKTDAGGYIDLPDLAEIFEKLGKVFREFNKQTMYPALDAELPPIDPTRKYDA